MSDKQKVVKLLQAAGGMVFGGYVRDVIAGDNPIDADVDVFFKDPLGSGSLAGLSRLDSIKKSLRAQGFSVSVSAPTGMAYAPSSDLKRIVMIVRSDGTGRWEPPFFVDLVFSATGQTNPFADVDADVNALYITEDGRVKAHDRFDVSTVIDHIRRKVYEPGEGMPRHRSRKMAGKGYHALSRFQVLDEREAVEKKKRDVAARERAAQVNFEHQQQERAAVVSTSASIGDLIREKLGDKAASTSPAPEKLESKVQPAAPAPLVEKTEVSPLINLKEEKKGKTMKETIGQRLARNLEAAAYQAGGAELTSLVKDGLLQLLAEAGETEEIQSAFRTVLQSRWGDIFVSGGLGIGLPEIPILGEDPRVGMLADQMQVKAGAETMQIIIHKLAAKLMPGLEKILDKLPSPREKARIAGDSAGGTRDHAAEIEEMAAREAANDAKGAAARA